MHSYLPFDSARFCNEWLPRVALEPLCQDHAPELARLVAVDDLYGHAHTYIPSPDDVPAFIASALGDAASGSTRAFVIRWLDMPLAQRATGNIVGCTRFFQLAPRHRRVQIGVTWLATHARRNGVNRAAKWLLLREAFEAMHLQRVEFFVHPANTVSRTALLGMGATFEGILRKHLYINGAARDTAMYSVVDDDWGTVNAKLRGVRL